MSKKVLAFDYGASSGRAILGSFNDQNIKLKEVHRFSNDPVSVSGTLYWDILRLFHEMKHGILAAKHENGFDSIGIDTWGVDFGLLGSDGRLLENPVHYRDTRTDGIIDEVLSILTKKEIYEHTGIQLLNFNTIFQLYYLAKYRKDLLSRAETFLLIPDIFGYFLTNEKSIEYTNATTTQLVSAKTGDWDFELIDKLGIPRRIFPKIIQPGSIKGILSDEICAELGVSPVPVVAVGSHDTASAVAAVPCKTENFIYVSCGTWSLFGTESTKPYINNKTLSYNLTNEGGVQNTYRLLKNIMGLWLIQESRRQWQREGEDLSYAELEKLALSEKNFQSFIDPDLTPLGKPGNLPKRISRFCCDTNQIVPISKGAIMRTIYESLALKYRYTFEQIKDITQKNFEEIHVVGGGTKDHLLCQMTANACGLPVIAGPIEATVFGNIIVQLMAADEISDLKEARTILRNTVETTKYEPNENWDIAYEKFLKIL